jgi:hypothetical protein
MEQVAPTALQLGGDLPPRPTAWLLRPNSTGTSAPDVGLRPRLLCYRPLGPLAVAKPVSGTFMSRLAGIGGHMHFRCTAPQSIASESAS